MKTLKNAFLGLAVAAILLPGCAARAAQTETIHPQSAAAPEEAEASKAPATAPAEKTEKKEQAKEAAPVKKKAATAPATRDLADLKPLIKLNGDSSLHKFHAQAEEAYVKARLSKAGDVLALVKAGNLESLEVSVTVDSLKSGKGGLDKNMYKAMEAKKFEKITFVLDGYTVKDKEVTAKGKLSIHGVTKDVELVGALDGDAASASIKGSYALKMSDYGIKPPVMMLGTIKTADDVVIEYEYTLAP